MQLRATPYHVPATNNSIILKSSSEHVMTRRRDSMSRRDRLTNRRGSMTSHGGDSFAMPSSSTHNNKTKNNAIQRACSTRSMYLVTSHDVLNAMDDGQDAMVFQLPPAARETLLLQQSWQNLRQILTASAPSNANGPSFAIANGPC